MRIPLDGRWTITTQDGQNFPGEVPGTIYTSMLKYGLCPDPYYGQNEEQVRKISEQDFIYSTVFDVDAKTAAAKSVTLCFDGIDTVADIFLNGEKGQRGQLCSGGI